jgi:hypothetical protein
MRHVYSRVTSRQPIQRRPQRLSLPLAVCYLLGRISRSAFPVDVGGVIADAFPGEYISCTLITPRLNGGVGTPSASVE